MPRRLGVPISILLAILPFPARACECLIVYPICREVRSTDAVFIGVAESVQPKYLDYWRLANGAPKLPLEKLSRLRSQGALEELRALYLELSGDLPLQERTQLENAPTLRELEDSFNSIASGGVRTRFKVLKRYKLPQGDDDEEPESDDFTTVWSDSGDCGVHFQAGETYLVYADYDEETGRLKTSICYRTRRLADAGADLAFLYQYEKGGEATTRLEGFVTSKRDQDRPTYSDRIEAPVAGVVVGMTTSEGQHRFTASDAEGRFWFDGLVAGRYQLSAFGEGYPLRGRELAGPQGVQIPAKGCATEVLTVASRLPLQ